MNDIKFIGTGQGENTFSIEEHGDRIAEMVVGISGKKMTVYHTEVAENLEGKGIGKLLINAMTDYARSHDLKVIPLCPYVHLQFKKHPEVYADVWERDSTNA